MKPNPGSRAGFTLVEVLVGALIMAISGLSIMQLAASSAYMHRRAENSLRFSSTIMRIQSWIDNEQTCRLAFGGPRTLGGSAVGQPALVHDSSITLYYPVNLILPPTGNPRPVFPRGADTRADETWTFRLYADSGTFQSDRLNLAKLRVHYSSTQSSGALVHEKGTGTATGPNVSGSQVIALLILTDSAGRLISCGPPSFNNTYNSYYNSPPGTCGVGQAPWSPDGISIECRAY